MLKNRLLIVLLIVSFSNVKGQDGQGLYLKTGYNFTSYKNHPFGIIVDDYNIRPKRTAQRPFISPGTFSGLNLSFIGIKKFVGFEFGFQYDRYKTKGYGYDSFPPTIDDYGLKFKIKNDIVHLGLSLYPIHPKWLRIGPGASLDFNFFKAGKKEYNEFYTALNVGSEAFYFSSTVYMDIIIGKTFKFSIRPFYHYPFKSLNLFDLEQQINPDQAINHSINDLNFTPENFGIAFDLCFIMAEQDGLMFFYND